ncbi:MAG: radical SAM protein, partial [Candidatus Shapirobacteria bacterium]|nr:radical SAM protein [Candidatus Shapirobacteria bacterium]
MLTKINELQAKTILTKTALPGCDYVVNPYNGCQFACMYCYAAQIARWKHPGEEWGSFLDVKLNAPELLTKELKNISGTIFFSSVTDPYVGLEVKYQLTRKCLQVLVDANYPDKISLQTKSPLITRDIDLLKKLKNVSIGFTVTTLDDKVSRFLEVEAPPVSARIEAIKELNAEDIPTYAFIGPVLPHFIKSKKEINELLDVLQNAGVKEVWFEHLHLVGPVKTRLMDYLKSAAPELTSEFERADNAQYRAELESVIYSCLKGRGLKLGLGKIIYHRDLPK